MLVLAWTAGWGAAAQKPNRARRQEPAANKFEPAIFGEGVISTRDHESGAAFTPDGKTFFFTKSTPDLSFRVIVVSHFRDGRWGEPAVATFSGRYSDTDPSLSPDGTKLFFASRRPVSGDAPRADSDIWVAERAGAGWGEPKHLDAPVNGDAQETSPSVAADGTLYFSSNRKGGRGAADIYRARAVGGKYAEPENLGDAVNSPTPEPQVFVTPDGRLLIFAGARPEGRGGTDLYISRREAGGNWTMAAPLAGEINSQGNESAPRLSPDGKTFYWTSTRGYGFAEQLEKRLTYAELSRRLRSPRNSLGDIYRIDARALGLGV